MTVKTHTIYSRENIEHNTDPQRRCYYGCHAKSEWRWTEWRDLYDVPEAEVEECLASWRQIGRPTCEFKAVPIGQQP